jgi:hypothetical protein
MMLLCTIRFSVGGTLLLSSAGLSSGRKARTSLQGSKLERNKVLLSAGYYIRGEGSYCFSL